MHTKTIDHHAFSGEPLLLVWAHRLWHLPGVRWIIYMTYYIRTSTHMVKLCQWIENSWNIQLYWWTSSDISMGDTVFKITKKHISFFCKLCLFNKTILAVYQCRCKLYFTLKSTVDEFPKNLRHLTIYPWDPKIHKEDRCIHKKLMTQKQTLFHRELWSHA